MGHSEIVAPPRTPELNGDETRYGLYYECPEACDRLNVFQWEWISDRDHKLRKWVRDKKKPVSQKTGVNTDGLLEAATEVATIVQRELHGRPSPLELAAATELWHFRHGYLNALYYLDGNGSRLAKDVEARVSPGGKPLAICLGSNKREDVETVVGPLPMAGYIGCLQTFPDIAYGPGRRWPRLCPECRSRRTNARNAPRASFSVELRFCPGSAPSWRPRVPPLSARGSLFSCSRMSCGVQTS